MKISTTYISVLSFTLVLGILIGIFVGSGGVVVREKVPYRAGDKVIVVKGFFTGQVGRLEKRVLESGRIYYTVDWENPKCEGGQLSEEEFTLIGTPGWE